MVECVAHLASVVVRLVGLRSVGKNRLSIELCTSCKFRSPKFRSIPRYMYTRMITLMHSSNSPHQLLLLQHRCQLPNCQRSSPRQQKRSSSTPISPWYRYRCWRWTSSSWLSWWRTPSWLAAAMKCRRTCSGSSCWRRIRSRTRARCARPASPCAAAAARAERQNAARQRSRISDTRRAAQAIPARSARQLLCPTCCQQKRTRSLVCRPARASHLAQKTLQMIRQPSRTRRISLCQHAKRTADAQRRHSVAKRLSSKRLPLRTRRSSTSEGIRAQPLRASQAFGRRGLQAGGASANMSR